MKIRIMGLILVLVVVILVSGCVQQTKEKEIKIDEVKFGQAMSPTGALSIIAEENGYFEDAGLNTEIKEYKSGKRAFVEGFNSGKVDVITTQGVPVVFNSLNGQDFKIIALINSALSDKIIVGRKDSGISEPSDLKGKKVATQKGSAVHFFLHLFLLHNEMSEEDIELSYIKAEDLPKALAKGTIDAFSMREPFVTQAKDLLGEENVVLFPDPGIYNAVDVVVVRNELLRENPEIPKKIIRALIKAEEFVKENPEKAKNIIVQRIGSDREEIDKFWPGFNLEVVLEQSLFTILEDEARWVIKSGLTEATEVPNYLDYIYFDALEEVKPEAVRIIH
ncbi:MAG: NrtA/SsuA/CpmA family ABC transporter substrate-binding protein [Candidatus Hydrothermarchaeales archaeon]